jgi:hypothetical protein
VWSSLELLSGVPAVESLGSRTWIVRCRFPDPTGLAPRSGSMASVLAAWGLLEWTFALLLVGLTGAVGLAFLYMVGTLFVNPGRRKRSV